MLRHRIILLLCIASQLVIAVHPTFVRHYAYKDLGAIAVNVSTNDNSIASQDRPVEIVAAHRIRVAVAISFEVIEPRVIDGEAPIARVTSRPVQSAPPFLASHSRGAFLREHALLI